MSVIKTIPAGRKTKELYENGRRLVTSRWVLVFSDLEDESEGFFLAVHVGKRLGKAVERNRLRRQVREAIRVLPLDGLSLALIVIPRLPAKGQTYQEMSRQLSILVDRLKEKRKECSLSSAP